jgi:PIN domain nuclease of toxin-antitoxin system
VGIPAPASQEAHRTGRGSLLQLNEAPLTIEVVLEVASVNLPHGDPADRFLAAARVFNLTLVMADKRLINNVPVISVLANQ